MAAATCHRLTGRVVVTWLWRQWRSERQSWRMHHWAALMQTSMATPPMSMSGEHSGVVVHPSLACCCVVTLLPSPRWRSDDEESHYLVWKPKHETATKAKAAAGQGDKILVARSDEPAKSQAMDAQVQAGGHEAHPWTQFEWAFNYDVHRRRRIGINAHGLSRHETAGVEVIDDRWLRLQDQGDPLMPLLTHSDDVRMLAVVRALHLTPADSVAAAAAAASAAAASSASSASSVTHQGAGEAGGSEQQLAAQVARNSADSKHAMDLVAAVVQARVDRVLQEQKTADERRAVSSFSLSCCAMVCLRGSLAVMLMLSPGAPCDHL